MGAFQDQDPVATEPGPSQGRAGGAVRAMPRRGVVGPLFAGLCLLATLTGAVALVVLLGAVIAAVANRPDVLADRGFLPFLADLASRPQSGDPEKAGFLGGIVGTLWLLILVFLCAIPVGVGAAIFLEEYPMPRWLRRPIQTNIANLAGVPSIVYGILGLALFVRAFGIDGLALGDTLWAGGLTLSLLVLPLVIIATQEALRAVPSSLREAAMALGASRWQAIRDHVIPAALPGILTGTILAMSRAIGETAPLLMAGAAGALLFLPRSPADHYTALPVEIYNYAGEPDRAFQAIAAGGILILLLILLTMNATAILIRARSGQGARNH